MLSGDKLALSRDEHGPAHRVNPVTPSKTSKFEVTFENFSIYFKLKIDASDVICSKKKPH